MHSTVNNLPGSIRPNVAQLIAMTNGVKINFKFVAQVFRFGPLPQQEPVDLTEAQSTLILCSNCRRSLSRVWSVECGMRHVACGNGEWHDPKTESKRKTKRKAKMKMKSKVNATTASHRRNQLALCDDVDVAADCDCDGSCDVDVASTLPHVAVASWRQADRLASGNWLAISFAATFRLQRNLPNMLQ